MICPLVVIENNMNIRKRWFVGFCPFLTVGFIFPITFFFVF